jgi:two-component system NtrC family response regulator
MVRAGDFREDLYYRLNVVSIIVPPLRDRREDIPLLVERFLAQFAGESGTGPKRISREAMDLLVRYAFPGNVRELENIVHRGIVLARSPMITTADLPDHVAGLTPEPPAPTATFVDRVSQFERKLIAEALAQSGGVQTQAARALGMSERHLRYKLKKYALD